MSNLLLSLGNPLLDMVAVLESEEEERELIKKCGLKPRVGQEVDTVKIGLNEAVAGKK